MKTRSSFVLLPALLPVVFGPVVSGADELPVTPVLDSTVHLGGSRSKLIWSPRSNVSLYRIEKSTELSPGETGGWSTRAVVEGTEWVDPEPPSHRAFYRVLEPQPEVFAVEPGVVARSGGVVTISGQCLPPGSALRVEIPGLPPFVVPLVPGPGGTWSAAIPGLPPGEPWIGTLSVVDGNGETITVVGQTLEVTDSGLATEPPPVEPPAHRSIKQGHYAVSNFHIEVDGLSGGYLGRAGGDEDCDDAEPDREPLHTLLMPALMKAKEKANRTKCSNNLRQIGTGAPRASSLAPMQPVPPYDPREVCVEQEVLSLATPAGPGIDLSLHYRSRGGGTVSSQPAGIVCGSGWTCSYDIRIVPVPLADGPNAARLYLFGGDGRRDVLVRQPDGSYRGDGMFREGRFDPDTTFRLTFADASQFIFCQLVGAPWSGRIGSIADANGVTIQFSYDASSRLSTITSQFGQSVTLGYDPTGALSRVTDHTGRFVDCAYFAPGEPGGGVGDLKSVSCPRVAGQAPLMGPATFTYSTGNGDDRLNHNLLSARDGAGRLLEEYTYSPVTTATDLEFDTVASVNRHRQNELTGNVTLIKFEVPAPVPGSPVAYRCIINDPVGRVCERDFDAHHREVACRVFTGFATPGITTTSSTNRPDPATRLRAGDPPVFETQCRYNPDHRIKIRTRADGTQERTTYGRELRRDCPVRERGNAHVITLRTPGGEERTITCDYLPGFGTSECDLKASDGKKHFEVTAKFQPQNLKYLAGGGKAQGTLGQKAKAWMVNNYEVHPVFGATTRWITSIGLPKITPKIAKESHGKFRLPIRNLAGPGGGGGGGGGVWDGGDGEGGCTDAIFATKRGYDYYKAQSDQTPAGHLTRLVTSHGQAFTWDYDGRGNCTAMRTPVAGRGTDSTYNALGQCTSRTTLNGPGSSFVDHYLYDASTGWLLSHVSDPDVNGTGAGLNLTTTVERSTLGHITRVVDPRGHDWLTEYDVCDRFTVCRTPAVGTPTPARIALTCYYDSGGLPARCDVEHRDATGALVAANPAYTAWMVHDTRGRVSRLAVEQRPVDAGAVTTPVGSPPALVDLSEWAVYDFTWNDAGECVQCTVPAASRGQSTDRVCLGFYDERGNVWRTQDGLSGAPGSTRIQTDYTPAGMVARRLLLPTLPPPPPAAPDPETVYVYDGFQRLSSVTDPMGNVTQYEYDDQGFTTISVYGETNDIPGSAGNALLARVKGYTVNARSDTPLGCDRLDDRGIRIIQDGNCEEAEFQNAPGDTAGPALLAGTFRPAFFDVFVADDVWTWSRIAPGTPAPHPVETATAHRSPAGLLQSVTLNGDTLFSCAYDTAGRLQTVQNARVLTAVLRDAAGNVISHTRTESSTVPGTPQKSFTHTSTFDPLHRCTSVSDNGGNNENWDFDSGNRLTGHTDARGVAHRFRYDGEHGGGAGTPPSPFSVLHECDADANGTFETLHLRLFMDGQCRSLTDSNGYTTTFALDSADNLIQCDFPDGTFESWGFDPYGRGNSHTRKNGAIMAADYDYKARARTITWTGGSPGSIPVPLTECRYNGLDQCVQRDQGDSHLVFTFDSLGNPLAESHNGHTVTRTFNHRGRTSITYPNGTRFLEARDAFGNLLSVSLANAGGGATAPPVSQMEYLGHRVSRETRANGVVTTYEYRGDGDPPLPGGTEDFSFDTCVRTVTTSSNGTVLHSTRVRRDRSQHTTQLDSFFNGDASPPGRRHVNTWDRLGRLTACTIARRETTGGQLIPESSVAYSLDLEGRRLTATGGRNPGTYTQSATLPPGDHQMGQYSSWPLGPLEWDDNGSLTHFTSPAGALTLVYDTASRLVAVNDPATGQPVATYAYDAAGRRTRSSVASSDPLVPPVDTFFIYDGVTCVQERGTDGQPNFTMAAAAGLHLCIVSRNGSLVYPHGGGPKDSTTAVSHRSAPGSAPAPPEENSGAPGITKISPITMRFGKCVSTDSGDFKYSLFTGNTGTPTERLDGDDAGTPIFLTLDGLPRPAATDTLSGFRWLTPSAIWCPENRLFQLHSSLYSPDLGSTISTHKEKPKESPPRRRHELTGHVTLIK